MKRSYFLVMSALVFIVFSCKQKQQNEQTDDFNTETEGYQIVGNLKNIPDSTWIYINKDNKIVDSTQIIGEKFEFTGSVDEPSSFFMMVGKTRKPELFVAWVENQRMTIEGEKGNIRNVKISGSNTHKEYDILKQRTDSLEATFENVISQFQNPDFEKMKPEDRNILIKKQNDILKSIDQAGQNFVKEYPDSYVSISKLNDNGPNWGKEVIKTLYKPLTKRIKESKYGQSVKHFISLPEVPKIGEKFIDFELVDINEKSIKISDVKSKYALIEFWASWCYPCRKENPNLIKTYNTYKDKGFEIIGVSIDNDKKNWIDAIKKDSLPWKQGVDLKGFKSDIALTYGINGIPDNFLIDEQGIIVAKTLRGNALENKLKELFTE
ncbi:TlpA disulfide reductase family protein [uncultured Aquimarina sp.]|uniref:TlpA disulfide reductase family protein n=1 Tax=uncultured Aquimarina sp. TaxID=575652 RepID=UPI00261D75EA|nr:TlpA disulfide reductase family protein [uncultured Aquimarina sp.]